MYHESLNSNYQEYLFYSSHTFLILRGSVSPTKRIYLQRTKNCIPVQEKQFEVSRRLANRHGYVDAEVSAVGEKLRDVHVEYETVALVDCGKNAVVNRSRSSLPGKASSMPVDLQSTRNEMDVVEARRIRCNVQICQKSLEYSFYTLKATVGHGRTTLDVRTCRQISQLESGSQLVARWRRIERCSRVSLASRGRA